MEIEHGSVSHNMHFIRHQHKPQVYYYYVFIYLQCNDIPPIEGLVGHTLDKYIISHIIYYLVSQRYVLFYYV